MATTRRYAETTEVSVERSQEEARKLLRRYGADQIRVSEDAERVGIEFRLHGWVIRFLVAAPALTEEVVTTTRSGSWRPQSQRKAAQQQEYRRRFRSLILRLKAKLESVSNGDVLVEEEFISNLVMAGGQTLGEMLTPHLEEIRRSGRLPELLPPRSVVLPPLSELEEPR
jgi:hypothetical protein